MAALSKPETGWRRSPGKCDVILLIVKLISHTELQLRGKRAVAMDLNKIMIEDMNPILLMSIVNKKLRNQFDSLDQLVRYYNLDGTELLIKLENEGYTYLDDIGQFL